MNMYNYKVYYKHILVDILDNNEYDNIQTAYAHAKHNIKIIKEEEKNVR